MKVKPSIAAEIGAQVTTSSGSVTFVKGGLGAISGLRCAGVSAGFRRNPERRDLALVVCDAPAVAAGVFTRNSFCAAPVVVSQAHLKRAQLSGEHEQEVASGQHLAVGDTAGVRAIVLNSGNANATTGEPGLEAARRTARLAAQHLACQPHQVLVASTGVIGVPLDDSVFVTGIPLALAELGPGSANEIDHAAAHTAAQAIMTTDTYPKQAAVSFTATQSDGVSVTYTIAGMVKGSGMIEPHMATLLGVLATDAQLAQEACEQALTLAMANTLNKVTVDSDTSTNDSVYLLATGATPGRTINSQCPLFGPFVEALTVLCTDLARQIAYDGEGATRLVTVEVSGAHDDDDADRAGRSIANSPLVKTAIAGHDANWGRIAMALGKSDAVFRPEDVNITLMGLPVCECGLPIPFDEAEALRRFEANLEIMLEVDLGTGGRGTARLWTCDLTHGYITINGDYRT